MIMNGRPLLKMRSGFNAFRVERKRGEDESYFDRKRAQFTRDYFDDDEDEDEVKETSKTTDEIDPLDAFMQGIDTQVKEEKMKEPCVTKRPERLNQMDGDSFPQSKGKRQRSNGDSDEEVYATAKSLDKSIPQDGKKVIEVLPPLNHSQIRYETFNKNFYTPAADIVKMSLNDARRWRQQRDIKVSGTDADAIKPIPSFAHAGFDRKIMSVLVSHEMSIPTPIQAQSFPIALSGRDMIGIAKTGSGKTLAFVLPMVVHIMDQREIQKGEGPIAIVLAPTRELAHQIYIQAKRYTKPFNATCVLVYGGVGKWDQIQALRKGAEVVVATPGRLIEMIKKNVCPMSRLTYLVLDEADRMFDMGFEAQLRSIIGQIRPNRQTLLFSATFRKRVEMLARDILTDPIRITIGKHGQANEDILQEAVVIPNSNKWNWLMSKIETFLAKGKTLIFVSSKVGVDELCASLQGKSISVAGIHGDKLQPERNEALRRFKAGHVKVLVATDIAARGLDIEDIWTVVNFDVAKNIETHIHRIGRTGRIGKNGVVPGTAYTLLTSSDYEFAGDLVNNLDISNQDVSEALLSLAQRNARFHRKSEYHEGGFVAPKRGRHGIGYH